MTDDRAAMTAAFRAIAQIRGKDLLARLGFAAFIGVIGWFLSPGWAAPAWFVAVVLGQGLDHLISTPLRRPDSRPSAVLTLVYGVSMSLNAFLYSGLAVFLWFQGTAVGMAFALLSLCGALINNALQVAKTPWALPFVIGPHGLYIIGLPLITGVMSPAYDVIQMALIATGGAIYILHTLMAVQRIWTTNKATEAAIETAQKANAAKSDFLATISHEIRTPMNAVVAAGELLRRTALTEEQADHVDMLHNASEVLLGLLNDVLDLSRIESGKLEVDHAPFDLVDKLTAAAHLWRAKAADGVTLSFEPSNVPARIMTDPLRFQQIVSNLLSNATKFTASGQITIRAGRFGMDDPVLWIEVEDSGSGMDPDTAARIFSSFEQGSTGVTRNHGGSGLGLAISRRLAELMGGSLTVRSELGKGSTFRFEIPLMAAEAAPAAAVQAADDWSGGGVSVLLAEDHPVNQRIVRMMLEPCGADITVAANGAEAVEMASRRPFDVILMDMQMPVMGGVEAAAIIRREGPNAGTPILALTANAMAEHRAEWAAVGVDVFITKPVEMQVLLDHVAAAVAVPSPQISAHPDESRDPVCAVA